MESWQFHEAQLKCREQECEAESEGRRWRCSNTSLLNQVHCNALQTELQEEGSTSSKKMLPWQTRWCSQACGHGCGDDVARWLEEKRFVESDVPDLSGVLSRMDRLLQGMMKDASTLKPAQSVAPQLQCTLRRSGWCAWGALSYQHLKKCESVAEPVCPKRGVGGSTTEGGARASFEAVEAYDKWNNFLCGSTRVLRVEVVKHLRSRVFRECFRTFDAMKALVWAQVTEVFDQPPAR